MFLVIWFRQSRHLSLQVVSSPTLPYETCFFRRLPRSRCSHGYDACRSGCHGLRPSIGSWRSALPTTSDKRAFGCCRDYGPRSNYHRTEQNRYRHQELKLMYQTTRRYQKIHRGNSRRRCTNPPYFRSARLQHRRRC